MSQNALNTIYVDEQRQTKAKQNCKKHNAVVIIVAERIKRSTLSTSIHKENEKKEEVVEGTKKNTKVLFLPTFPTTWLLFPSQPMLQCQNCCEERHLTQRRRCFPKSTGQKKTRMKNDNVAVEWRWKRGAVSNGMGWELMKDLSNRRSGNKPSGTRYTPPKSFNTCCGERHMLLCGSTTHLSIS